MKPKKIAIAILFLVALCAASISAALYFSSTWLINHFHFTDIAPSMSLPFTMAHLGVKKVESLAHIAIFLSFTPTLFFGLIGFAALMPKKRGLHGDARFANKMELVKSGLLVEDKPDDKFPSVIVGKVGDEFLLFRGQQFLYLAAPTRSGKGVGIVIPNLLHYRDSVVVLDIKGENFEMTAGFRAKCGQEVHKFAPDDENSNTACWNPLTYVRDDERFRVSDLMGITNILYPPSDDVWSSTAENLFLGVALYIMDTKSEAKNFNIATIKRYASSLPFLKDEETFLKYVAQRSEYNVPLSAACVEYLQKYAQTGDKVRNSISISFDAPLAIFSDPITAKATAKSTFDFRDVRKKRMSIYVVIKPSAIDKFGKFLNLFFQQLLLQNMNELPQDNPALKYQCLLLLDEFAAMGRVSIIEKASAYMAGYNMRLLLIFQSKSQVEDKKLYDKTGAKTMLTNMALQIIFAPRDDDDAKDYSEMLGYMTEKGISKSKQLGGMNSKGGSTGSESTSDQRRAVLLPQEIKAIGMEKAIVSMENMLPALVDKIFWYKEPVFVGRMIKELPHVPCQADDKTTGGTMICGDPITSQFSGEGLSQPMPQGASYEIGFSPRRNAKEIVLSAIIEAKAELLIAAYSFTSRDIALAISEKHAQGVDVKIIVDAKQNDDKQSGFNACKFLQDAGITVIRSTCYEAMHHKFIVVDGESVQLGSFNYSVSADKSNAETAIYIRNAPPVALAYRDEWHRLANEPSVTPATIKKISTGLNVIHSLIG
jgi:type IV secretion system protein VirD4